jgi:arylsulfatase A-like enzyme
MGDHADPPALPPERVAFPELLAAAGYETTFFGKLHTRHEGGRNFGLQIARLASHLWRALKDAEIALA